MQARAARTRQALVRAAAFEFDRHGYAGASIVQVCRAAGITTGALAFHFGTKSELADAVQDHGCAAARAVVDRVRAEASSTPALSLVVDLTTHLARLLEEDTVTRSAARLTRERPGIAPAWWSAWLPTVSELADRAQRAGQLHADTPPAAVAALAAYLLVGTELRTRAAHEAGRKPDAVERLQQLWKVALRGIRAARGG
ncbi:TetR family transcriptional regulator [Streptomyces spinoverrucosus]|uniref:TetR/AcrR family transcriptional regulator n=1 Tax=Streptomyces spinoverrucosus TaxID=284043 RepID=UPI0018C374B3|nr:TetR/AcrR family transcriptional regulator [Streptomyces spinoverrucosus]MBG0855466.1 TetR family transcriptional regulator [Streptomyces spinoverrucosus]